MVMPERVAHDASRCMVSRARRCRGPSGLSPKTSLNLLWSNSAREVLCMPSRVCSLKAGGAASGNESERQRLAKNRIGAQLGASRLRVLIPRRSLQ